MSGEFMFGVRDLRCARWIAPNSYGGLVDMVGVSQLELRDRIQTATLEGDDDEIAIKSKAIGVDVTFRFATTHATTIDVFAVLSGQTPVSSGGNRSLGLGSDSFQYFGLVALVYDLADGADHQIFVPKCKVINGLSYSVAYGGFKQEDMTAQGVKDAAPHTKAWYIYQHDPSIAIALPPNYV